MRAVQKVSSHVLWKIDTIVEEDTRNIVHRTTMPQPPSKQAPWDLTQFSHSPSAALLYLPESHQRSEISSLSKVIIVLGKARSCRAPNLGCRGDESPGWLDVSPKNSAQDVMHEQACCRDEAANHQWPIAVALWIIWIVSVEECSSLTHSVILNAMATQNTRSLWRLPPPQPSTVKSSLLTHEHSSPFSLAARSHPCPDHIYTGRGRSRFPVVSTWNELIKVF